MTFARASFCWIQSDKNRPAVVFEVRGDKCVVCTGTGTDRADTRAVIDHRGREGKALGLYKPTFFYASGVKLVAESQLTPCGGSARAKTMFDLTAVVAATNIALPAENIEEENVTTDTPARGEVPQPSGSVGAGIAGH